MFQSLSRDSGRLNFAIDAPALRNALKFQSLSRDSGRLNRIDGERLDYIIIEFQSLSRDSGRLNADQAGFLAPLAQVSIPQSGFGAFEPTRWSGWTAPYSPCFNPSVGIRGV